MDFVSAPSLTSLFVLLAVLELILLYVQTLRGGGGIEDIICKETQLYPSGCKYLDLAACTEFAVVVV